MCFKVSTSNVELLASLRLVNIPSSLQKTITEILQKFRQSLLQLVSFFTPSGVLKMRYFG